MAKKRSTKKRVTKKQAITKSRSKGKRRTGQKKSTLPELEAQYTQLMALTQDSQTPQIRENARVLAERMAQFKAGKIKAEQVKATINIQMKTIQALAAMTPRGDRTPTTPRGDRTPTTPSGDRTPNLHETDLALKLLEIGLKLVL